MSTNPTGRYRLIARLHILRGDVPTARAAFLIARDPFERLGMRRSRWLVGC
jgi:hypothetical protein